MLTEQKERHLAFWRELQVLNHAISLRADGTSGWTGGAMFLNWVYVDISLEANCKFEFLCVKTYLHELDNIRYSKIRNVSKSSDYTYAGIKKECPKMLPNKSSTLLDIILWGLD